MDPLDNVSQHPPLYPWQPIHDRAATALVSAAQPNKNEPKGK
jgi:hypothetical protein